ncbi:hypothetical protein AB0F17_08560 [Nonomuraea sp. NPDC026600]|uniref:hypothetical protein n=1 Tax=Nonomuraea sp. NPDC026600 TaxID=3155363 RepID=UPI0033E72E86
MTAKLTAVDIKTGDHVLWLTPFSNGETARILDVQDSVELPGIVEITEADDWQNEWWPGAHRTRLFRRDRADIVAARIA